jgi:hypothetical protein
MLIETAVQQDRFPQIDAVMEELNSSAATFQQRNKAFDEWCLHAFSKLGSSVRNPMTIVAAISELTNHLIGGKDQP